jgi:hypothetical protein
MHERLGCDVCQTYPCIQNITGSNECPELVTLDRHTRLFQTCLHYLSIVPSVNPLHKSRYRSAGNSYGSAYYSERRKYWGPLDQDRPRRRRPPWTLCRLLGRPHCRHTTVHGFVLGEYVVPMHACRDDGDITFNRGAFGRVGNEVARRGSWRLRGGEWRRQSHRWRKTC